MLLTMGLSTVNAGTKVMYSQPFETVTSPEEVNWSCAAGTLSIGSDEFGKFMQFALGANNGRSCQTTWGAEIYGENAPKNYTVSFDFSMATAPNNQFSSEMTIFTDQAPKANANYGTTYQNWLFDMTQTTDANTWYAYGDQTNTFQIEPKMWYNVTLNVDVDARTVSYNIESISHTPVISGTYTVPEGVSMYAEGFYGLASRYYSVYQYDNFNIQTDVDGDFANKPVVALTRLGKDEDGNLNLNLRAYSIQYGEDEILHVIGTDGKEEEYSYADTDGNFTYETTTSGTLTAWTTSGDASSEKVVMEVDCSPCELPVPQLAISSVEPGYAKQYTVTIDNSQTPLSPQIFFTYSFTPEGGTPSAESGELTSGSKVEVGGKGVLTLTTKAFGYQSTTTSVTNDQAYELKKSVDFARMNAADITALGFTKGDDLNSGTTSGENNWTGRKRLYYNDAATETTNDQGEKVYTAVYPFGYVDDSGDYAIHRYHIESDKLTSVAEGEDSIMAKTIFAPVEIWSNKTATWYEHIGLMQNATTSNYNNVKINDLGENDVVVVNTIDNYGSDSNHPVVNTTDEYYAQLKGTDYVYTATKDGVLNEATGTYTITYPLYRIQTVLVYVNILSPKGGSDGIENVQNGKLNTAADGAYYTLGGVKIAKPVAKGVYIHNGKKIVITK